MESLILGTKCVFRKQDLQMFSLKLKHLSYLYSFEVVGHSIETQLQSDENLNKLT